MKVPEILAEQFELLADAPNGVAKLREFVFGLAVRGELVPQDPSDEPADILLSQFDAFKEELIAKGDIRRAKAPTNGFRPPFELPASWSWSTLHRLTTLVTDGEHQTPKRIPSGEIPLCTAKNVRDGHLDLTTTDFVATKTAKKCWERCHPQHDDILMVCVGATTGRLCLVKQPPDVVLVRSVALIRSDSSFLFPEYLALAIKSPLGQQQVWGGVKQSAQPCLYIHRMNAINVSVPPLAEQRRIVAKVDELMSLCDELEERQGKRSDVRIQACTASHAALTSATTPKQFARDWTRIGNHFDLLYDTPQNVQELRQVILQLAVQGKLVEQDPGDEPAEELLGKTAATKRQMVASGELKTKWKSVPVAPSEEPFSVPSGWKWARIVDGVERVTVGFVGSMKKEYVPEGVPFLRTQNVRANRYEPEGLMYVSEDFHRSIAKSALEPGDVVVVRSGNVGTACVIPDCLKEANCSDLVVIKRPMAIVSSYLAYYMNSAARQHVREGTVGIALTHFNTQSVASLPISTPPLAEQKRIVAKVDRLMSICDELESKLIQSQADSEKLMEAVVAGVLGG